MDNVVRLPDEYCDYRLFSHRKNGRIPCLAVDNNPQFHFIYDYLDIKGEIKGIYFQKVDEGKVKPCLDEDIFSPVDWPNSSTRGQQSQPNLTLEPPMFAPPQRWYQFGHVLFHLRAALLKQMKPPNGPTPETLYDAFVGNFWNGGINNKRDETPLYSLESTITQMLGQNMDHEWESLIQFKNALTGGFCGFRVAILNLLNELLHIFIEGQRFIQQPPTKNSNNATLSDGMVHCLVYGLHSPQIDDEYEYHEQNHRGRSRHKVICRKAKSRHSRSRSCSPSPENDLENDVINTRTRQQPMDFQEILQNPDDYELKSDHFHSFFQLHKPSFLIVNKLNEGNEFKTTATVIVEISSHKRFGKNVSFQTHLKLSSEQLLQRCLAGVSDNQQDITGLLFVPDGIKLIQVQLQKNANSSYKVRESGLVRWHETGMIYALLQYLETAIQ